MRWISFILTFLALSLSADAAEQPNIILIMADDIGYECFGCYGSEQYRTPHIDKLAERGMRFEHCYSQPLCTPSRVKIMTGLSNVRNYAAFSVLRSDQKTFGHFLKDAGYRTAIGGKWQLYGAEHYSEEFRAKGMLPQGSGFDRHCLWQVDKLGDRFWNPMLTIDGELKQFEPDDYGPDIVTDYLLDFMAEEKDSDSPFFVYFPMILVHNPFLPAPGSESRESKDKQRNFEDMVAHMDEIVGRIVKEVEDMGIAENTLILFTGDNGTNSAIKSKLGDRIIKGGKGKTDDSGTRVPLVAYWPETIKPGQVTDRLTDFSDFVPSFQVLAGSAISGDLDGRSFVPTLKGQIGQPREWIHCFYHPRPERGKAAQFVRDQKWKLYDDGRFYHVAKDGEEKNPLEPKANQKVHAKLKRALDSFPAEGQSLLTYD